MASFAGIVVPDSNIIKRTKGTLQDILNNILRILIISYQGVEKTKVLIDPLSSIFSLPRVGISFLLTVSPFLPPKLKLT